MNMENYWIATEERLLPEARSLGELLARLRGRVSPVLIGDPEYDSKSAAPSPAWASTST